MNESYVGDVGDFSKFALLRRLSACAGQAGLHAKTAVLWWATRVGGGKGRDGRHTGYVDCPLFQRADPGLVEALRAVQAARSLASLEAASLLKNVCFHREFIDGAEPRSARERPACRKVWLEGARRSASGAQFVFFDPDNGLASCSVTRSQQRAKKSVFADEMGRVAEASQTVILYHHATRRPVAEEVAWLREQVSRALPEHGAPRVWRAPRWSPRYYVVAPASDHASVVDAVAETFRRHEWSRILEEMA